MMKQKIIEQKHMRDRQLAEAKARKSVDFKNQREHEHEQVSKLQYEIEEEKRQKALKKKLERENAWKVINEN